MTRVLVTGFDPFANSASNASEEAVRALSDRVGSSEIITRILPCVFGRSSELLRHAVRDHAPDIVICVGEAGGRSRVSLERYAINRDDARIPDNSGQQPTDRIIVADAPLAVESTLPVKAIVEALQADAVPAELSLSAGSYVCNHVFYTLMHLADATPSIRAAGFVHVPVESTMPTALAVRGIETVIRVTDARGSSDITAVGGRED